MNSQKMTWDWENCSSAVLCRWFVMFRWIVGCSALQSYFLDLELVSHEKHGLQARGSCMDFFV